MKRLSLCLILALWVQWLPAQIEFFGFRNALCLPPVEESSVEQGMCELRVQVFSYQDEKPMRNFKVTLGGDSKPMKTNALGEVKFQTARLNTTVTVGAKGIYRGGSCSGIPMEIGKLTVLQLFLAKKDDPIVPDDGPPVVKKPVIYLYPEVETEISLRLAPRGEMTFSFPGYGAGWNVVATPSGEIRMGGHSYPYLFWEGELARDLSVSSFSEGFVVEGHEAVPFLQEKLAFLGLNAREQADFITFWGPQLQKNERNFVHFSTGQEYARLVAGLEMSVVPESEIRVNMFFAPVGAGFSAREQVLTRGVRKGFTVVEWGGAALPPSLF